MRAGSSAIDPATVIRNLGVMIDAELSMREYVNRVAQVCFFHLRRLRPMRARLGRDVTLTLVTSLVLSRLDYCNSVLAGLPASILATLKELHWLPIKQRVDYKLCLLVPKWWSAMRHPT